MALGEDKIVPTRQDLMDAKKYYKSAWLTVEKEIGDIITDDDMVFKRPGTGISSYLWNKTFNGKSIAATNIPAGTMLTQDMLR